MAIDIAADTYDIDINIINVDVGLILLWTPYAVWRSL